MQNQVTVQNFEQVWENILQEYRKSMTEEKEVWIEWINEGLDTLLENDFFGTEGQCDPRGDNRD